MPDIKFGKKVVCSNCEAKFYDLNRKPAICPHCGTEYEDTLNETIKSTAKQVFIDDVDTIADNNLVGSNATESTADDAEIELNDDIDEDTISLEDSEVDNDVITSDVDIDLDNAETNEGIDQD